MNAVNSAEHHRASTFYVDSKGGCDENDGRSEAAPFKTLERVSRESYGPGDRIRFRGGRTYCGSLTLNACGHASAPVRVEAYGSGTAPKIAGQGGAAVTIRAVYLTLEGLEITNPGGLFGIHILPLKSGENSGITVSGCYIHDVNEEETAGWGRLYRQRRHYCQGRWRGACVVPGYGAAGQHHPQHLPDGDHDLQLLGLALRRGRIHPEPVRR